MDSLIINGGKKLIGNIPISGSKNACLPMMIASLMTNEQMTLNNIPMLSDVKTLISILKSLGTNIEYKKNNLHLQHLTPFHQLHVCLAHLQKRLSL